MSNAPVIILAAPFSGAAALAAALGAHPQFHALPQLNLFMADRVSEVLDIHALSQGAHADGLLRALAQLEFGAQTDAHIAAARHWLAEHAGWSTLQVLEQLAVRAAPRRLVLVETETPLRPMDLRRLAGVTEAVLIHQVRHPYAQGLLHAQWLTTRLFVPPDFKDHSVTPACIEPQIGWLRANQNLEDFAARGASSLRLRDEDYEDTLPASLLQILGVEAAAGSAADYSGYGPPSAPYGLDDELMAEFSAEELAQARGGTLDSPLPWREGKKFESEVIELARRYGYR